MTVEKFSEIIGRVENPEDKRELFAIAVDHLGLETEEQITLFASMCGYPVATLSDIQ